MTTINREELEKEDLEETEDESPEEDSEETEETPEPSEEEEKPTEPEDKDIDYYTPDGQTEDKPQRSELEKAQFTAKSVINRIQELGGDPTELIATEKKVEKNTETDPQYATKHDIARMEARQLAKDEREVNAIMAWVDRGLTVEDAHYMANKGRVKAVFDEMERGSAPKREATGAGQRKVAPTAPEPDETLQRQWAIAGLVYDPKTKTAKGKFTEEYWNGKKWVSRRIK